jgi:thioredoxin-disulfide reductase
MTEEYDFIIIGAGGTGLAAAMYGARLGLKTLILGHTYNSGLPIGGTITMTNVVENYPGIIKTSGLLLSKQLKEHAESYDLVTLKTEEVLEITKGEEFLVKTKKQEYSGKTLLFATGTKVKKLEVPGAEEFENRGVNYCALCDGPLYRGKIVGVVGGSDSAGKDALILAEHAKEVYIIYRGEEIRSESATKEQIKKAGNIKIINNTNIVEVKGNEKGINEVIFDKEYEGKKEFFLDGLFVAIGHIYLSDLAKPLGIEMTKAGEIIINHKDSTTNVEGIFAAGDVTDKPFKQLITGVADGCTASHSAYEYIISKR